MNTPEDDLLHKALNDIIVMAGPKQGCSPDLWAAAEVARRALATRLSAAQPAGAFQSRVGAWLLECFGHDIAADKLERGDRFIEEALELLQSGDYPPERVAALTAYVYGRPKGEPSQEVGGTMVTLAAYCWAHDLNLTGAAQTEIDRISDPEIITKIRAKQVKNELTAAALLQREALATLQADFNDCNEARAHWKALAQSAEAALAALREGMEGLADTLDAEAKEHRFFGPTSTSSAYADAAARIRAVLEGKA